MYELGCGISVVGAVVGVSTNQYQIITVSVGEDTNRGDTNRGFIKKICEV